MKWFYETYLWLKSSPSIFFKINNSEKKISSEAIDVFIVFLVKLLKLKNSSFLKNLTILGKKEEDHEFSNWHLYSRIFDKIIKT